MAPSTGFFATLKLLWQFRKMFRKETPSEDTRSRSIHKRANILAILALWCFLVAAFVINVLAGLGPKNLGNDLFKNDIYELIQEYAHFVTPAEWSFVISGLIFFWLFCGATFYLTTIFLTKEGIPVYLNPVVISKTFAVIFGVNLLCNVAWVFTWNYELFIWAEVLLVILAITNCIVTALLSRNLAKYNHRLQKVNPKVYWCYVILGQFGHQLYTTWTIIASIFQLIVPAHYWWGVDMEVLSVATIATLLVVLCLWFMADISIWYTYQPYSIIPYLGVLWGFSGVLDRKVTRLIRNQAVLTFIGFILALNTGFLIIKTVFMVKREKKRLFRSNQVYY